MTGDGYALAMSTAQNYRALVASQREAAAKTDLSNRRIMHERSAMSWEAMAEAAEASSISRHGSGSMRQPHR